MSSLSSQTGQEEHAKPHEAMHRYLLVIIGLNYHFRQY